MKDIVILYHADCPDGFGGAWAAHNKFGDKAEYIGVSHDQPVPSGLVNKKIYMIDFAYSVEMTKDLISHNKAVTAIDHHITGEEAVKLTQNYSYATDHSGSVLAWKYFYKDKSVPLMLQYIEDRDLWKFKLSHTAPIVTYIDSCDYNFSIWDRLVKDFENDKKRKEFIEKGTFMLNYREELIKRIVEEGAKLVKFEGYETYVVNAPHEFADRISQILYTKKPPLAIRWSDNNDGVHVSLRSDDTVDVAKIAQKFGGGGHKAAAGFSLPSVKSFPWKEIK